MKLLLTFLVFSALFFATNKIYATGTHEVAPNAYATITGTGTFLGPLSNAQRTYQLLIQASQLTHLVGRNLTGFKMRIPASASANWPTADITFSNYDIYLSKSVEPSQRSLTFANNIVGPQTQVRSGSLTILANSYTFGGSPNAFGPEISFTSSWLYTGGNLLIEIRHQGFTGTSRSTDALLTSTPGYGTIVSGCWTGNYTGTSGSQGNFTVVDLISTDKFKMLKLTSIIEGLYDPGLNKMVSDSAKVYLRNDFSPYAIVDSAVSVLDSTGNGYFKFNNASNGISYYLVVDQRNSINTWSAVGNLFSGNYLSYDFTTAAAQAYGNNQVLKGTKYTVYSGDVNKDGIVDLTDTQLIDNDAADFKTGYVPTDVNGDDYVDISDAAIADNNAFNFVSEVRPD